MRMTPGGLSIVNGLSVCCVKRYIVIGIRNHLHYKGCID
jgi:hypothetical protein